METSLNKKKLLKVCYGISSKIDRLYHVPMWDFDGVSLAVVETYLKDVQEGFDLSDIYIIKSEHGYNAICLDILPLSLIYNIGIMIESPADRKFMEMGFKREYYTLRFDEDKQLLGILKNKSVKYEKSLAHKLFLEWFFCIKIPNSNFNEKSKLDIIQYTSKKNGYHLVEVTENDLRQL